VACPKIRQQLNSYSKSERVVRSSSEAAQKRQFWYLNLFNGSGLALGVKEKSPHQETHEKRLEVKKPLKNDCQREGKRARTYLAT